jgi:hypothetical protein
MSTAVSISQLRKRRSQSETPASHSDLDNADHEPHVNLLRKSTSADSADRSVPTKKPKRHDAGTISKALAAAPAAVATQRPISPLPVGLDSFERARWHTRMEVRWEFYFSRGAVRNCAAPVFLWATSFVSKPDARLKMLRSALSFHRNNQHSFSKLVTFLRSHVTMRDPCEQQERVEDYISNLTKRMSLFIGYSFEKLRAWFATLPCAHACRAVLRDSQLSYLELIVVCILHSSVSAPSHLEKEPPRTPSRGDHTPSPLRAHVTPNTPTISVFSNDPDHEGLTAAVAAGDGAIAAASSSSAAAAVASALPVVAVAEREGDESYDSILGLSSLQAMMMQRPLDGLLVHSSPTKMVADSLLADTVSPVKASASLESDSATSSSAVRRMRPRPLVHLLSSRPTHRRQTSVVSTSSHPAPLATSIRDAPAIPSSLFESERTRVAESSSSSSSPGAAVGPYLYMLRAADHAHHKPTRLMPFDSVNGDTGRDLIIQELYDSAHRHHNADLMIHIVNALLHDAFLQAHAPWKMEFARSMVLFVAQTLRVQVRDDDPPHVSLRALWNAR